MSGRVYGRLCGWFGFKVIENGILIRYPLHPTRYWAFRLTEQEFRKKYWDIISQMALNRIGEAFKMLDSVAEIAQGENFGEPIPAGSEVPKEPELSSNCSVSIGCEFP